MKRYWLLVVIVVLTSVSKLFGQEISFVIEAPSVVVKGQQFQLQYILKNGKGTNLNVPAAMDGFDILYGPSESEMYSQTIINGKSTSESKITYIYLLMAEKEGEFTLPAATIKANGKNYTSNTKKVKVLPPDKNAKTAQPGRQPQTITSQSTGANFDPEDAFIRAIFSKTKINEQEAVAVTFRFYTVLDIERVGKIEFPEFEGFMTEEIDLPSNVQLELENYKGRNYYSADVKRSLLFPQRSGKITIPSGKMDITLSVSSGKNRYHPLFGTQEIMESVNRTLKSQPITLDVAPLPEGKPIGFSGGVGSFNIKSSISKTEMKANEAITFTVDITGTGNMKLIKNPQIELDKNLEVYDPKINNNFTVGTNGLSGTKTIEYLFIPRYAGTYTLPPIEFSYFDLTSKKYKTVTTESYTLKVDVDPNANKGVGATSYMSQQEVQVEQDIRYLKTSEFNYSNSTSLIVNKLGYIWWYIVPVLLFVAIAIVYRKQIKANADIAMMRTKKANKVATRRLRQAKKYMQEQNNEGFYDEVLRGVWGYLSDKLTIPVANLNRENVETELAGYGAAPKLVKEYIGIIDTCEFARYAPVHVDKGMDKLYKDTVDAIGKMENTIKRR